MKTQKRFVVLHGDEGVSREFKTFLEAKMHANKLIKSGFKGDVEVDKLTIYPKAKPGQIDWSQSHFKTIQKARKSKPKKEVLKDDLRQRGFGVRIPTTDDILKGARGW